MRTMKKRLNSDMKGTIIHCACNMKQKQIAEGMKTLVELKEKLQTKAGDKLYNDLISAEDRALLNRLPEGFVTSKKRLTVWSKPAAEDRMDSRYFDVYFSEPKRLPFDLAMHGAEIPRDHWFATEAEEIRLKIKELEDQNQEVYSTTWELLEGVRTVKQLFERWPEVKELPGLPADFFFEDAQTALVPTSDKINELLGIDTAKTKTKKVVEQIK